MLRNRIQALLRSVLRITTNSEFENFSNSGDYWEKRYASNGNSGIGSYGRLANYKAEFLNEFVTKNRVQSVIEFGSGDGNQLSLAKYPSYIGFDISETAILNCREKFTNDSTKTFFNISDYNAQKADLSLSLEVIFHLIEDDIFYTYMDNLFNSTNRFVIIYSSNLDNQSNIPHVRHRKFTDWIDENRKDFSLISYFPNRFPFSEENPNNTSFSDFYIFKKSD